MDNRQLNNLFSELATPLIADACVRLGIEIRVSPTNIRPLSTGDHIAGWARPVQHFGSVDVFFEAMELAAPGDILVIDNGGREDEGCIGDLTALEAQASGLAGLVVWGCHRDTTELQEIGLPVFSHHSCPVGPLRVDARSTDALTIARFGAVTVCQDDIVFADADGVLFVTGDRVTDVLSAARTIRHKEQSQAEAVRAGNTLRMQLRFHEFLEKQKQDSSYSFREHLREIGGSIEE